MQLVRKPRPQERQPKQLLLPPRVMKMTSMTMSMAIMATMMTRTKRKILSLINRQSQRFPQSLVISQNMTSRSSLLLTKLLSKRKLTDCLARGTLSLLKLSKSLRFSKKSTHSSIWTASVTFGL